MDFAALVAEMEASGFHRMGPYPGTPEAEWSAEDRRAHARLMGRASRASEDAALQGTDP